jgi:NADH-quinone oxidoreductase subunit G
MATIYIDNKPYEVKEGQNLLHACLGLGFDIPYFCWHPALHSVGACRQCAVKQFKDEKDTRGKIVMSCMTPAADGTRISIDDPEVREFRASVIEWLMLNHPHDCPVCDEGGECHLQDMTVMTGHAYRRNRFRKRTHRNQYLGPFLNHEMNRCIQCYRCVRFYCDYAGGRDLNVFSSHHHVYFGRQENGILENEFSGNLVEVCPTGVFTDKTLKRHYTRKWDLQTAPSVCVHCGLGCNTIPGERSGKLRRILNRYNSEVNSYFLCDRGRFGYEFVNGEKRVRQAMIRNNNSGVLEPVSEEKVLTHLSDILYFGAKVIGIGSPRASLEANFTLRTLVGPEHFFSGISEDEDRLIAAAAEILGKGPACTPSLREVALSDAVFILGEDVINTAPLFGLALRQSVRQKPMEMVKKLNIPLWNDAAVREVIQQGKGPLFIAATHATKLDDIATQTCTGSPDDLAALGLAVAHLLDPDAPGVPDLRSDLLLFAQTIADSLKGAERPLILSGVSSGSEAVLQAAANAAWALCRTNPHAALHIVMNECNSLGLGLMSDRDTQQAFGLGRAFDLVDEGKADTVIILENDLFRREDPDRVAKFLDTCAHVIVLDHLHSRTAEKAEVVLPAGTFAESGGTLVNSEGRAQRFFQVFAPEGQIRESWVWLRDAMSASGHAVTLHSPDDILSALAVEMPVFGPATGITPPAGFRIAGQKIPRQPHRYSGRTAMLANLSVHEPAPADDPESALSFSMEGYEGMPPPPFISRFWSPGWNSVQSLNKFQSEVGGHLRGGDPGKRLLEPAVNGKMPYFAKVPPAFEPRALELLIVPLHHIFGSEELSVLSPGIAERAPKPYLAMNPEDAERLQADEGSIVELTVSGRTYHLGLLIDRSLCRGVAGLPLLAGFEGIALPAWGRVGRSA